MSVPEDDPAARLLVDAESVYMAQDVTQRIVVINERHVRNIVEHFGPRHYGRTTIACLATMAITAGGYMAYDTVAGTANERSAATSGSTVPTATETQTVTATVTKTVPPPSTPSPTTSRPEVTPPAGSATGMVVPGKSANYDGFTKDQVKTMENCGNATDRVLLTFDDYSTLKHMNAITAVLAKNNIGAIFFPYTHASTFSENEVSTLRSQGFWVGNHSATHPNMHKLSKEQIASEIERGVDSDLFRPPYGATYVDKSRKNEVFFDGRVSEVATQENKRICMWGVDTQDWAQRSPTDKRRRSVAQIIQAVKTEVRPGSAILMHEVDAYNTLAALPGIIDVVHAKGLKFCVKPSVPTTSHIPKSLPCEGS